MFTRVLLSLVTCYYKNLCHLTVSMSMSFLKLLIFSKRVPIGKCAVLLVHLERLTGPRAYIFCVQKSVNVRFTHTGRLFGPYRKERDKGTSK